VPAWRRAGLEATRPVITASTIGIGPADEVAAKAAAMGDWPVIKIKVDGESHIELIRIVHQVCPAARLIVDANQAWDFALLDALAPEMAGLNVALIEQPLAKGCDAELRDYAHTIPLAADESCTDRASVAALAGLYQFVNIKLDKTGGLTEALAVAETARAHNLGIMIGCMAGTSLAMAPAAIIAQRAGFVDLDGPLLHTNDRTHGILYNRGAMDFPAMALWG
jgi:L-alanine-DL-glutamate epimerase-like enolase superfamily enzyme